MAPTPRPSALSSNFTLYAQSSINIYSINFDNNTGSDSTSNESESCHATIAAFTSSPSAKNDALARATFRRGTMGNLASLSRIIRCPMPEFSEGISEDIVHDTTTTYSRDTALNAKLAVLVARFLHVGSPLGEQRALVQRSLRGL